MSYILLDKPFTAEECKVAKNQFIEGIITVNLQDVIENDLEGFLDILEYSLIGNAGVVTDLEYKVVGNGMNDSLHIRATGFADLLGDE